MPRIHLIKNIHKTDRAFNDVGDDPADNFTVHRSSHSCMKEESDEKPMHRKTTDEKAKKITKEENND
jgi:hypothetical protein